MNDLTNDDLTEIEIKLEEFNKSITDEYNAMKFNPNEDYLKGVAFIAFTLSKDYFRSARVCFKTYRLISGSSLVRSNIENAADIFFIYCSEDKKEYYAKRYVTSIEKYSAAMRKAAAKGFKAVSEARKLRHTNRWTGKTIDERLLSTGPALTTAYDILSTFSHPNPGAMNYLTNPRLLIEQTKTSRIGNCLTQMFIITTTLNHSDIKSVQRYDLEPIANKLGTQLSP